MAPFKVLAIDGGGIRGIIPALILQAIEARTGRPISDLFDMLSGTSTGGIIALGLTLADTDGKPAKSATDIVHLYEVEGTSIFPSSLRGRLRIETVLGPKYDDDGIETTLQRYFGDARLQDALKPVVIPSYDVEKQSPIFFKSVRAKASPADSDFLMRQVARATSAAPTYFPPERIDCADPLQYYALIDGGVIANNPAMCAYAEAIKMGQVNPGASGVLVVSIGTGELRQPIQIGDALRWGQLEWARPIIDIALQGSSSTVDYQLQQLLSCEGADQSYYRLQFTLTQDATEMDDASDRNVKHLIDLTQQYLSEPETRETLDDLCARLTATA
jgi:patatin-like phospholipase/acyl hydrolase